MKKLFLAAVLSMSLSGAVWAAPEGDGDQLSSPEVAVENVEISNTEIELAAPADDDMAAPVQESEIAHKMTQAEKAHNAAVNDSWGGAITIVAMCIVISALVVLSLLFLAFGKISKSMIAKKKSNIVKTNEKMAATDDHSDVDSGDVIAAIAVALSEHFGEGHDMEDTILTIRKLQRAYSPWNSKIYNLRHNPEITRNALNRSAF